jgi:Flp pilus assembly protein TadG
MERLNGSSGEVEPMVCNGTKLNDRKGERGSITIMTAIFAVILLLMVGLTIDISRIYLVRSELQNAADAAALTAARELNGGTGGIDGAVDQATNVIANTQGLRAKTNVAIASVEFAVNLNDNPYLSAAAAKAVAANIRFVKVTTAATSTTILFASSALGVSNTQTREAVAGMSVELGSLCDFFPAAVGLADPDPTPGPMTLKFAQGTGTTAHINDKDYIVLEVPCITGNGQVETAMLAAGEPCACAGLGDNINMTPSSNFGNGGRAAGDGMNTRFGIYASGYSNALTAANYAADTNVSQTITYQQYINNDPSAGNDRRVVIAPIIEPKDYPAATNGEILGWGKFFLKSQMTTPVGNCEDNPPCGYMEVEYLGKANVGASGTVSCGSGLTTAVLYK